MQLQVEARLTWRCKHVPTLRNLILTGEEREPGFHQFSDVQTHENAQLDSTLPLLLV